MPTNWKNFEDDGLEEPALPLRHSVFRTFRSIETFAKRSASLEGLQRGYKWAAYPRGSPLWVEMKNNVRSGCTVSLVSVPLSISLALAGGATPVMGVVTAFWAGLFASLLGGSHFNIVGPTGALSGILADASLEHGVDVLPLLAILSGVIGLVIWALKLDKYIMFIPSSVIHGFTVGVAFIIGLNQLNSIFGLGKMVAQKTFLLNMRETFTHLNQTNPWSVGWFVINFGALMVLSRKVPKVPWAIVISVLGILVGFLCSIGKLGPVNLQRLENKYPELDLNMVRIPSFSFSAGEIGSILTSSIGVVFIGILETLISARIADTMTKSEHSQSKEVFGYSISNIICGVLGGIPATAALARTALNVKSGATSRVSGVINSVCVLLLSLVFLRFFKYIPMATIGALLVMVAFRMIAFDHLTHMFKYDKGHFVIAIISAVVCVVEDTMAGILAGGVVSLLMFTNAMSKGHSDIHLAKGNKPILQISIAKLDKNTESGDGGDSPFVFEDSSPMSDKLEGEEGFEGFGDMIVYRITGQLTYVNAPAHYKRVQKILTDDGLKNIVFCLQYCWYMDLDGIDILKEIIVMAEAKEIGVAIAGPRCIKAELHKHPFYLQKLKAGAVFQTYKEALNYKETSKVVESSELKEEPQEPQEPEEMQEV